ncbi:hypothetical protein PoB_000783100 [Plakobranchus ocellatus]|uniref:Uncharacterized protein n=1 Tax=Plakobranchus ocellatus TaxID=259542 RepID=A0AAV3YG23_9GAST|nr:hypothetical protein PoB_000783100 [Plakobranchus ocellatus]
MSGLKVSKILTLGAGLLGDKLTATEQSASADNFQRQAQAARQGNGNSPACLSQRQSARRVEKERIRRYVGCFEHENSLRPCNDHLVTDSKQRHPEI